VIGSSGDRVILIKLVASRGDAGRQDGGGAIFLLTSCSPYRNILGVGGRERNI